MALQDKGFNDPQIEVRSQSPRLEMLQSRLRQAGLRPVLAGEMLHPGSSDPYLVDVATLCRADLEEVVDAWRTGGQSRPLVMLGAIPTEFRRLPILHLRDTDQLSSLGPRLAIRQREGRRRRELGLRVSTAERLGLPIQALPKRAAQRVLYLGESSPAFIALRAALKASGIETVAALSAYTARDYLSSGRFAAAIVHPATPIDEATMFLSRFDTLHLSHQPELIVIGTPATPAAELPDPVSKLISLRLLAGQSPELVAEEIAARLIADPAPAPVEDDADVTPIGRATTLFSRTFLESHLAAQLEQADESGEPISLLAINMTKAADQEDFVQIVNQMLRDADMSARLDDANICITLPATPYRGAIAFARRIETAWGRSLSFRAVERRQFHTVETLIGALIGKPVLRRLKQA